MKYTFKSKIYKTGINQCVDVPRAITSRLTAEKGRIRIKGQINGFDFATTLMPVKDAPYRLFVNQAMLKGGATALGQVATFNIAQDNEKMVKEYPRPSILIEQLKKHRLTEDFDRLTASRKREILKYLNNIKTEETLLKNMRKLIMQLKNKEKNIRIP